MKLKIYLSSILILLFITNNLRACDPIFSEFHETICQIDQAHVISGKVISKSDQHIELEVFDFHRGCDPRKVIKIWDGTTVFCNGPFPSLANSLGQLGDSVILIAEKITSVLNDWDQIGDFRRLEQFSFEGYKPIRNSQVYYIDSRIDYRDYLQILIDNYCLAESNECTYDDSTIFPNPAIDQIFFYSKNLNSNKYYVFDMLGRVIYNGKKEEDLLEIDIHDFPPGVYILTLFNDNDLVKSFPFIKKAD